jgi:hypothetical protein
VARSRLFRPASGYSYVGRGNFSTVWGNRESVIKVPRQIGTAGYTRDKREAVTRAIGAETVALMSALRADPTIRKEFGDIFPRTSLTAQGLVRQERVVRGVTPDKLPDDGQLRLEGKTSISWTAHEQINKLNDLIGKAIGGRKEFNNTDYRPDNFRFDPKTGHIVSAFDPFLTRTQVAHTHRLHQRGRMGLAGW